MLALHEEEWRQFLLHIPSSWERLDASHARYMEAVAALGEAEKRLRRGREHARRPAEDGAGPGQAGATRA